MARGNEAKEQVINKIIEAFGNDFITVADKKVFLWSKENGERVQVALSLTCPKVPIDASTSSQKSTSTAGRDFTTPETPQVDISEEDKKKIEDLKRKLGLIT